MIYDYIVVGTGSMGSAASYFLAKAGHKVLMVDAFTPPHTEGSHHGDTRLIRFAYGEGEKYVPFVLRAKQLWDEIAQESGLQNFKQTGVINVGKQDDPFIEGVERASRAFNLNLQRLSANEVNDRYKGMQLPDDFIGLLEPSSGVMLTKPAIEGYIQQAIKFGATAAFNTKIEDIKLIGEQAEVQCINGTTYTGKHIIVTAGAWARNILQKTEIQLPMQPTRKTFAWFEAAENLYNEAIYPGFTFQFGDESYYGFPSIDGAGLKVGRHDGGLSINPDEKRATFGEVNGDIEDLQRFIITYMPKVGTLREGKVCMYSMTPDEDFIIDRHPIYPQITFAAGFSGHGFKFASAVGEALSELAQGKQTTIDITPFQLNRFH